MDTTHHSPRDELYHILQLSDQTPVFGRHCTTWVPTDLAAKQTTSLQPSAKKFNPKHPQALRAPPKKSPLAFHLPQRAPPAPCPAAPAPCASSPPARSDRWSDRGETAWLIYFDQRKVRPKATHQTGRTPTSMAPIMCRYPGRSRPCPSGLAPTPPKARAVAHTAALHGSITVRPAAMNALGSRDATAKSWDAAIAAIYPSGVGKPLPAARALAASSP